MDEVLSLHHVLVTWIVHQNCTHTPTLLHTSSPLVDFLFICLFSSQLRDLQENLEHSGCPLIAHEPPSSWMSLHSKLAAIRTLPLKIALIEAALKTKVCYACENCGKRKSKIINWTVGLVAWTFGICPTGRPFGEFWIRSGWKAGIANNKKGGVDSIMANGQIVANVQVVCSQLAMSQPAWSYLMATKLVIDFLTCAEDLFWSRNIWNLLICMWLQIMSWGLILALEMKKAYISRFIIFSFLFLCRGKWWKSKYVTNTNLHKWQSVISPPRWMGYSTKISIKLDKMRRSWWKCHSFPLVLAIWCNLV